MGDTVYKYGLIGVASSVQFGKGNGRITSESTTKMGIRNAAGGAYIDLQALDLYAVNATFSGDLTVSGTTTTLNVDTITTEDSNIELGSANTTDVQANGGGITLKGTTNKTISWDDTNDSWDSSEHWNLVTGKEYRINDVKVIDSTSLGSAVVSSSLTSVGTLTSGTWNANTITVPYGGTGATTFTSNGILYGNGTSAVQVTAAGTQYQALYAGVAGVPGYSYVSETRGSNGKITISTTDGASTVNYLSITASNPTIPVTLSTAGTDTNIDLVLDAKGTGVIVLKTDLNVYDGTTSQKITTTETNGDIVILPNGTGVISVTGTTNYEANVTSDDDIPNKKYVDDLVAINAGTIARRVTIAQAASTNIGTVLPNPATEGVYVQTIVINVTTAYDNNATATVEDGTNILATATKSDLSKIGVYIIDTDLVFDSKNTQLTFELTGTPTVGAATVTLTAIQV